MGDHADRSRSALFVLQGGPQYLPVERQRRRQALLVPEPLVDGLLELLRIDAANRPPERAVLRGLVTARLRVAPAAQVFELQLREGGGKLLSLIHI